MLTAMASVAQSEERWSRYPRSRVQFPALSISDTRIYLTLKTTYPLTRVYMPNIIFK